ncbi:MAG: hypothetical protein ABIO98_08785, partial [Chitinophagales bacterium]
MVRQITSWFLLATFLFAAVPQDLIHLLAEHEDTIDVFHADLQVSKMHLHCCSLELSLPLFIGSAAVSLPKHAIELARLNCRVEFICLFSSP